MRKRRFVPSLDGLPPRIVPSTTTTTTLLSTDTTTDTTTTSTTTTDPTSGNGTGAQPAPPTDPLV